MAESAYLKTYGTHIGLQWQTSWSLFKLNAHVRMHVYGWHGTRKRVLFRLGRYTDDRALPQVGFFLWTKSKGSIRYGYPVLYILYMGHCDTQGLALAFVQEFVRKKGGFWGSMFISYKQKYLANKARTSRKKHEYLMGVVKKVFWQKVILIRYISFCSQIY